MRRKQRSFLDDDEALDPAAGLVNLFDAAMVFAVALMVTLVSYLKVGDLLGQNDLTLVKNPGKADMEIIRRENGKLVRYQSSSGAPATGSAGGKRVGVAYQLENGDVIYVPE